MTGQGALVSVVIPVYNGTNYLAEAVRSALEQRYEPVEIIVVDDGSTDETWDLIQSFGDSVRGIRKDNGGVATALNLGVRESSGRYIAWLSHDDLFLPAKLEHQVRALVSSATAGACYGDYHVIDEHGVVQRTVTTPSLPRARLRRELFGNSFICGSTMLIDRRCFDTLGPFREDLKFTQDAEMWLRILGEWEIVRAPLVVGARRDHSEQGSRSKAAHVREEEAMFTEFFRSLGPRGLFPELGTRADGPEATATALIWLGDSMAFGRHWFPFADRQYRCAIEAWPSWRNPARLRSLLGSRLLTGPHRWYRRLRHELGVTRKRLKQRR